MDNPTALLSSVFDLAVSRHTMEQAHEWEARHTKHDQSSVFGARSAAGRANGAHGCSRHGGQGRVDDARRNEDGMIDVVRHSMHGARLVSMWLSRRCYTSV